MKFLKAVLLILMLSSYDQYYVSNAHVCINKEDVREDNELFLVQS
jgi:hypothetical protein